MASVGVDVGGTKIEAAVLDDSHNVVLRKRVPTPGGGADMRTSPTQSAGLYVI